MIAKEVQYSGYADNYLIDREIEAIDSKVDVKESAFRRLLNWLKRIFGTSRRPLTPLEDSLQAETRRLLGVIKERNSEIIGLKNEVEVLMGKAEIDKKFILILNEVIESLRSHREADVLIDGKRIAMAETYFKGLTGGGLNHGSY